MIKVNKEMCVGCCACAGIAPDVFEMDEHGLSKVIEGATNIEGATEAAGACPVGAIQVEETPSEETAE